MVIRVDEIGGEAVPVIADLAQRIWPVCYREILTSQQIATMLEKIYSHDALRAQMAEDQRFWVVYDDDTPVGFAAALVQDDVVWLKKLYVLSELQGKGFGKALMQVVEDVFSNCSTLALYVHRDNVAAKAYYRRYGFEVVREESVMMGDYRFVDVVMEKKIRDSC